MPANWPTCTAVQIPLPAYAANMAGWLLASPSAWNWVTTMYRSCPTSSSVADRRSDLRSNALLFMTILLSDAGCRGRWCYRASGRLFRTASTTSTMAALVTRA